jgi:YD repeat-containing protein
LTDIRLGSQGIETGTRGTLYFDDFESRRFSNIGILTDPGVDDPGATNAPDWTASTYTNSATIPHAVTSIAIEGGSTNTYTYDANGNMTCRIENGVTYIHTYNAETCAELVEATVLRALSNAMATAPREPILKPGRLASMGMGLET